MCLDLDFNNVNTNTNDFVHDDGVLIDLFVYKGHLITLKKYPLDADFSLLMLALMALTRIFLRTYNILLWAGLFQSVEHNIISIPFNYNISS